MSSDSIHDAVLCAERRGRTPARSIDAAIVKEPAYGCDCRLANGIYRHNSSHDIPGTVGIRPDHRGFIMRDSRPLWQVGLLKSEAASVLAQQLNHV
jgi:hypothetical protein